MWPTVDLEMLAKKEGQDAYYINNLGKILVWLSFSTAISTHYRDYYASCNISVLTKISANHVHEFL